MQRSGGWADMGRGRQTLSTARLRHATALCFSMAQGVKSPSMSGSATELNVGGSKVYSDALLNNHLIGPRSSQGMPDSNHTLVPTLHDFTYDVYFLGSNLGLSQALEFDMNQFFGDMGFIWGHECRIAGGNEWDIWDNQSALDSDRHSLPSGQQFLEPSHD